MTKKESNQEPTERVPYAHLRYSNSAQDVKDMGYLSDKHTRSGFTDEEMGNFLQEQKEYFIKDNGEREEIKPGIHRFITNDSGERVAFESGMQRDTQTGKPRYDLLDGAFLKRQAELLARGADKYGENNWKKANSQEELQRFKASAFRHLMQWLSGETDEDHAAAVAFNLAAAEYVQTKLRCSAP